MRKKIQIVLGFFTFLLCIFGFAVLPVVGAPVRHEAIESYYSSGDKRFIRIDMQGDAVYEDASGYTRFAVWVYGQCEYTGWYSTRVLMKIYTSTYYKKTVIYPYYQVSYYWDPSPYELIDWTGDWECQMDMYGWKWEWSVGSEEKYCNGVDCLLWCQGSGSYATGNSIDGDYRYLGWAKAQKSGAYTKFDGLIKLHIDNGEAENWDYGKFYNQGGLQYYLQIQQIRVKIHTYFQYEWFGWRTLNDYAAILGDGTPSSDLSNIPLVLGEVDELVFDP